MDRFEEHRSLLEGIAYRMCGVLADAQDIVQETHLKWSAADQDAIRDPRAWLVTVCSRRAMDLMKSVRMRREMYVGTWLPEPFLDRSEPNPAEQIAIDETVSVALMLALEKLSPAERAAFLLHEAFAYGFPEIARILGKSAPACRQLASRARTAVRAEKPRFKTTAEEHRRLLEAFFDAAHSGNAERLQTLLAESVELHADGGGKVKTAPEGLRGREAVAQFFLGIWRGSAVRIAPCWFNGSPGLLIYLEGRLMAALCIGVESGQIHRIYALRNPAKLAPFGNLG